MWGTTRWDMIWAFVKYYGKRLLLIIAVSAFIYAAYNYIVDYII